MSNSEIKKRAKASLKGNLGIAILVLLVYSIINSALSSTIIGAFATGWLLVGLAAFYLSTVRTGKATFESFFTGFTEHVGTKLWSMVLVYSYTVLWVLLFIIPGIVKSYSYAMTPYILLDNPELGAKEAITESRKMMKGHKMELLLLDLSFIGWIFLSMFTCGTLLLYVIPYKQASRAEFYRTLKGDDEQKAEETFVNIPH